MATVGSLEAVKEGDENEEDETEEEEVKERHVGDFEEEATGGKVVVEEKKNRCFAKMLFFGFLECFPSFEFFFDFFEYFSESLGYFPNFARKNHGIQDPEILLFFRLCSYPLYSTYIAVHT